ncbi:MAG: hypothetical protein LBH88_02340, partial [Candidatus Methanoplasma sp.]|nr:hypothetical protein [Candidatus Methanoplasma sp.]
MAMISDKEWKLGKNYISDLGVSKTSSAKYLFNGGCVVFAAIFIIAVLAFAAEIELTMSYYVVLGLSIALA